ncbi:MAG TPA: hypothetical protein VF135_07455 [Terriglobales bacterium]
MNLRAQVRQLFHDPTLLGVEIGWRWLFGACSLALCFFAAIRLQHSVLIFPEEEEMLASRAPLQMAEALLEVWQRVRPAAVRMAVILIPAVILLWVIAATTGRAFVFSRVPGNNNRRPSWVALGFLHLIRALSVLLIPVGYVACSKATALVTNPDSRNYALAIVAFVMLFSVVFLLWSLIHWVLSLACIFAGREDTGLADSLARTASLLRNSGRALASIAMQNAGARTVVALLFTVIALLPLVFYQVKPLFWASEIVIFLVYCAFSDVLLLARLMGYIAVVEGVGPTQA